MSTVPPAKASLYNVWGRREDGKHILANAFSRGVIALNEPGRRLAERILADPKHGDGAGTQLIGMLQDNGFLIPGDTDELELLRERHEIARRGDLNLSLSIVPTHDCNLACSYCYQDHEAVYLSDEIKTAIVAYVRRNLPGKDLMAIVWFGGEPLMSFNTIVSLSGACADLCVQQGCTYQSAIVTNGVLLNRSTAQQLRLLGVTQAQVTMDGPPDIHDSRRHYADGGGTFHTVLSNLLESAELLGEVLVRVNVDQQSAERALELLPYLAPIRDYAVLCFRATRSREAPDEDAPWCVPAREWFELEARYLSAARAQGFRASAGYTLPGGVYCAAYQRQAVTVDARGDVHLCPVAVGQQALRLGTLSRDGCIEGVGGPQADWAGYDPFQDAECRSCIALPVCMGGCVWYWHRAKGDTIRCSARVNLAEKLAYEPDPNCRYMGIR